MQLYWIVPGIATTEAIVWAPHTQRFDDKRDAPKCYLLIRDVRS